MQAEQHEFIAKIHHILIFISVPPELKFVPNGVAGRARIRLVRPFSGGGIQLVTPPPPTDKSPRPSSPYPGTTRPTWCGGVTFTISCASTPPTTAQTGAISEKQ